MSVDRTNLLSRRLAAPLIATGLASLAAACNGSGPGGMAAVAPPANPSPKPEKGVPLALILCFLGRTRHRPNDVKRSVVLDVVFPILSIAASVFLMVEFDWRGQFSNPGGGLNLWAVAAMIVGYVVLPAALYLPWKLGVYDDTPKQPPEDR